MPTNYCYHPSVAFQSLNRDSGCSDRAIYCRPMGTEKVSIPQSGFWLFRPTLLEASPHCTVGFNPSIGILVVQTSNNNERDIALEGSFNPSIGILVVQTVGYVVVETVPEVVSIPQSGFWLFRLAGGLATAALITGVSIPQSGFWLFRPSAPNPVVYSFFWFQSLNRDSGCSDS